MAGIYYNNGPPFPQELSYGLWLDGNNKLTTKTYPGFVPVPGRPNVSANNPKALLELLEQDLLTRTLDHLAPSMFPLAKHESSYIGNLSLQVLKGRSIVITEDPGLHLVWYFNIIYLMPIPEYLFSRAFWNFALQPNNNNGLSPVDAENLRRAALGFMRSYAYLIQRPSDVRIAMENHLLPSPTEDSSFTAQDFLQFFTSIRRIEDDEVSPRYTYGELRLTRVNWAIRLFASREYRQLYYHRVYWQTSEYVAHYFSSLLFTFASVALVLGAMQVMWSIVASGGVAPEWQRAADASWVFSAGVILGTVIVWAAILLGVVGSFTSQIINGIRREWRKRDDRKRRGGRQKSLEDG